MFSSLDVFHGNETTSHCRQMFPGAMSLWADESELLNELGSYLKTTVLNILQYVLNIVLLSKGLDYYGDYYNSTDYNGISGDGNNDSYHAIDDGSGGEVLESIGMYFNQ